MDTLDPKDLLRYQTAQREAAQAQRVAAEAQQAHIAAVGAAQFVNREIAAAYGLQPGDSVNPQTGTITRGSSDVASGAASQSGPDNPAKQKNQRRK